MTTNPNPDPLAYGPSGYRCGCGKDAHSNLTPCQPDPAPLSPEREAEIRERVAAEKPGHFAVRDLLAELDRVRAERAETNGKLVELTVALRAAEKRVAELHTQVEKLQGLHTCPALATNGDRCCRTPGHVGDHSSFAGRHIWSPAHAAEAARLHGCKAEYGGPGYTHCELLAGHEGQHGSAIGNMRRATWGGEFDE